MKNPTLLGVVGSVAGTSVSVQLADSIASGLAIINGTTYRVGQVGSFVRIPLGYINLYGIVSEVGVNAVPESLQGDSKNSGGWITVQLVGEAIGSNFERGISQHPNIKDLVHIVTEEDLSQIYGTLDLGQVLIGRLSSSENIPVRVDLDKLLTRHSAVLGSTGSGKSTTVASLLRSISESVEGVGYPSSRIILLDIHGEYSSALSDIAKVYRVNANKGESELFIPYWALEPNDLSDFLTGKMSEDKLLHINDKIYELKLNSVKSHKFAGVSETSLTVDTPIPYSLKRLWLELINAELMTLEGEKRDQPALISKGDVESLTPPSYKPHGMGAKGPFINNTAPGIRRALNTLRSRLLDKQYDFLLHPGDWEPDENGKTGKDISDILEDWLGHDKPITILDLSGVPSAVLNRLISAILKIIYEAMFWSREKSEGAVSRPLLMVMEEAHRYLSGGVAGSAEEIVQRIVKEGRKYGMGAMIVSQRPSEVDETILSQCGTFFALRLSNKSDRSKVQGTLPDSLAGLMDMLPILRTGEAIVTGEAARLPIRCRVTLPSLKHRPNSRDPEVAASWKLDRRKENYERVVTSWRSQSSRATLEKLNIKRERVDDEPTESGG